MYAESVKEVLIPDVCYGILIRKFQGLYADELFEEPLKGNCVPLPNRSDSEGIPLISGIHRSDGAGVPFGDFIVSQSISNLLGELHEKAYEIRKRCLPH